MTQPTSVRNTPGRASSPSGDLGVGVTAVRYGVNCSVQAVGHEQPAVRDEADAPADRRRLDDKREASPELARAAGKPFGYVRFGRVREGRLRQIEHEPSARLGQQTRGLPLQLD